MIGRKLIAVVMILTLVGAFTYNLASLAPPAYAYIPPIFPDISSNFTDTNFKQAVWEWLGNTEGSTPGSFTKLDLINRMETKNYTLSVSNRSISGLAGIESFAGTGLLNLYCTRNNLTSLPPLPDSLKLVHCYENQIASLPTTLPSNLENFDCYGNQLTNLPALPSGLVTFCCYNNKLTTLPALPDSLETFDCSMNQLTTLPALPSSLTSLSCTYNQLTSLPALPGNLDSLLCYDNQLTGLPALPGSLTLLNCMRNQLASLPDLPSGLERLYCSNNQLTELPALPMLLILSCSNNQLTDLPTLPISLGEFSCSRNYLNVFSGDLKNEIDGLSLPRVDIDPQYRFIYTGGPLDGLDTPHQLSSSDFKKQSRSSTTSWTDLSDSIDLGKFIFASSDKNVAKVTKSGLITACGAGTCDIHAMFNGADAEFTKVTIPVTVAAVDGANLEVVFENSLTQLPSGAKATITAVVTNKGNWEAAKNAVEFYIGDQLIITKNISKLKPGKSKNIKVKFTVPAVQGVSTLTVKLASSDWDAYPGNNQDERDVAIVFPDLTVTSVMAKSALVTGKSGTLTVGIANQTIAKSGAFVVRVYGSEGEVLGEKKVSSLKPGPKTLSVRIKVPSTSYFRVVIDTDNQVAEENENNNEKIYSL